jgi:hypothetical protein
LRLLQKRVAGTPPKVKVLQPQLPISFKRRARFVVVRALQQNLQDHPKAKTGKP